MYVNNFKYSMRVLVTLAVMISQVWSWGEMGHMLTACIAEIHLDNSTSFHRINKNIQSLNHLTDGRSNSFIESACWADDLKSSGTQFWFSLLIFRFSWHFSNREINTDGVTSKHSQNTNILQALEYTFEALRDLKEEPTFQTALFSRFLIHLMGDIHQPLHVSTLFNSTFVSGDMGGNLIHIQDHDGKKTNLHTYWDNLFNKYDYLQRPLSQENIQKIKEIAKDIMSEFPYESLKTPLDMEDKELWVQDEYYYSRNQVYGPLLQEQQIIIDDDYYNKNIKYIKHQLALGGYRLAQQIEKFFGQKEFYD